MLKYSDKKHLSSLTNFKFLIFWIQWIFWNLSVQALSILGFSSCIRLSDVTPQNLQHQFVARIKQVKLISFMNFSILDLLRLKSSTEKFLPKLMPKIRLRLKKQENLEESRSQKIFGKGWLGVTSVHSFKFWFQDYSRGVPDACSKEEY